MTARSTLLLGAFLLLLGCSARVDPWLDRYPVVDGHHRILDDDALAELDASALDGYHRAEIEALFGPPLATDRDVTHAANPVHPTAPSVATHRNRWLYHSNQGGHKVLVTFSGGSVRAIDVVPLEAGAAL